MTEETPKYGLQVTKHGCAQKWVGWNLLNQNPAPCGKVQAADRSATLWRTDCQMAGHSHGPARTLVVSTLCPCHNSPVQHKTKQLWLPKQLGLLKFLHGRFPFKLQHNWTKLTDHEEYQVYRSPDKSPPWKPEPSKVAQTSFELNPSRPTGMVYSFLACMPCTSMLFDAKWCHNRTLALEVHSTTSFIYLWRATLASVSLHHLLKQSCQQKLHYKHRPRLCTEQSCPGLRANDAWKSNVLRFHRPCWGLAGTPAICAVVGFRDVRLWI